MKIRTVSLAFSLVCVGLLLPGCPIYGDGDSGCVDDGDCLRGYACDVRSGLCVSSDECERPSDCRANETCARSGQCVPGDCTFASTGCVAGYSCEKPQGYWECVRSGQGSSGSAGSAGSPSPSEGGAGGAEGGAGGAGAGGSPAEEDAG